MALNDLQFQGQPCIIGQLNNDTSLLEKSYVSSYLNLLAEFGIKCLICVPSREEILSSRIVRSCIDQIKIKANHHSLNPAVISN